MMPKDLSPETAALAAPLERKAPTAANLLLPIDAERLAQERGLPPLVRPLGRPEVVFDWNNHEFMVPISLAVMWIAWRHKGRAGWQWWRYRTFGRRIWAEPLAEGQVMTLDAAEKDLRRQLPEGHIKAFGVPDHARPTDARNDVTNILIPALDWEIIQSFHDGIAGFVGPNETKCSYAGVVIKAGDLFKIWPEIKNNHVKKTKPGPKPTLMEEIIEKMLSFLRDGGDLSGMKLISLAAKFGGSQNTANAARREALQQFRNAPN